jgi:hypothetical protein
MPPPEWHARPAWQRTGDTRFPAAARVEGRWWVLRINSFPDHPPLTLFVDGKVRYDVHDLPPTWGQPLDAAAVVMEAAAAERVLAPVEHLVAYGSEAGQPCDDPFCCG